MQYIVFKIEVFMQKNEILQKVEKISLLKRSNTLLLSQKSAMKSDIHFDIHLSVKVHKNA